MPTPLSNAIEVLELRGCKIEYIGHVKNEKTYAVVLRKNKSERGYFNSEGIFALSELPRSELSSAIQNAQVQTSVSQYKRGSLCKAS